MKCINQPFGLCRSLFQLSPPSPITRIFTSYHYSLSFFIPPFMLPFRSGGGAIKGCCLMKTRRHLHAANVSFFLFQVEKRKFSISLIENCNGKPVARTGVEPVTSGL